MQDINQAIPASQHVTALEVFRWLIPFSELENNKRSYEMLEHQRNASKSLLLWPPNLFAFTSLILGTTGAYYLVVSPARDDEDPYARRQIWPPQKYDEETDFGTENKWKEKVRDLGQDWRKRLNNKSKSYFIEYLFSDRLDINVLDGLLQEVTPPGIQEIWTDFSRGFDEKDIKDLLCKSEDPDIRATHWKYFVDLMTLHAIADEACVGWGIRDFYKTLEESKSPSQAFAEELLIERGTLATIHEDRCRILPKRHNPNVGMTLRSISSNLAFYHHSSVEVKWRISETEIPLTQDVKNKGEDQISSLNILLLPWPYRISASDFSELKKAPFQNEVGNESFFIYNPPDLEQSKEDSDTLTKTLKKVLRDAKIEAGRIDLVILPELAISEDNIEEFEEILKAEEISGYIAGVRRKPDEKKYRFGRNMVYCKFLKLGSGEPVYVPNPKTSPHSEDYKQNKHHRWKLDRSQIIKYQLGGSLSTNKVWWEGIKLARRRVTFINVGEQITICPLICEDLARQEPISDLIRAVGPTLVVAILMDGPQKVSRWSAGYANVLADDPRSSVLTFTCLGMVERSASPGYPKSRGVALWKDPHSPPNEIELDEGRKGIVLYLNVENQREIVADGRKEDLPTSYLTLGGIRYV
jgi:hypothetical protein